MSQNKPLNDVSVWREELGLLPVPLYPGIVSNQPFVLMNGSRGNFCLDTHGGALSGETRSIAWSSNVSHYVSINQDNLEVQRWDQRNTSRERYTLKSVRDNLERFHEYLERDAPSQELTIVSHTLRIFRKLRATLGERHDGSAALKAFLCLLACATDQADRHDLVLTEWGLSPLAAEIATGIAKDTWAALVDELLYGRRVENLNSNLTLMLRHAAGQVFQEAHYEAVFLNGQQLTLTGLTPAPVRVERTTKSIGLHFTPPALARSLVEEGLDPLDGSVTIFDPACGSGEFLRESLRQLELRQHSTPIKIIGWDISEAACDMARFVLAWESRNIRPAADVEIHCVDSLSPSEVWPSDVDKVFMNPPFVSWQDMTAEQRGSVSTILSDLREMRPDISHAFLLKATECLKNNGVLGAILPASLMDGGSAAKLRQWLGGRMSPRLIAKLGSQNLFPNAQIDAAFYVGQSVEGGAGEAVAFWADHRAASNSAGLRALRKLRFSNVTGGLPFLGDGFNIYRDSGIGHDKGSWSPRPYEAWGLLRTLSASNELPLVKDIFDVRQGVLTGFNRVFLLSKNEWADLPAKEQEYFRPAVVNRSIQEGVLNDFIYLFYPYGDKAVQDEGALVTTLPTYYERYLIPSKGDLLKRSGVTQQWWTLTRQRAWQVSVSPRLVSTYFGDAGSFAWDKTGRFVVVQGYAWVPRRKTGFEVLPDVVAFAYLSILNSKLFSTLLSATSNHVGGGQWNLSTRFVSNIVMPNLLSNQARPDLISDLATIGKHIHDGNSVDSEEQEELVHLAYGLVGSL